MKKLLVTGYMFLVSIMNATTYVGTPGNYTSFIPGLIAGDTLFLNNGTYTNRLTLNGKNGTITDPIVFIGASQAGVIFTGNACCNTVSLTMCSYLVIKNFTIDGLNIPAVDAVKAEGSVNNAVHHITLEYLKIVGHGGDQQTVGISTKCTTWDWVIRRCVIDGAGTGMYLGNSTGNSPFVNGLIEGNVIKNTIGYNIEVKHENDNLRTVPNMTTTGKTVIRYNVFTKELNASTGPNARPCLLVGNFPPTSIGSTDYYEIYNNFFYQNPVEALFQGTGNIMLYNNVFVNHQSGGWGVQIREHNAFQPRNIKVFHNTVVVNSGTGINFYNCNTAYSQSAEGNAVFASPSIAANTTITNTNNITGTYAAANTYVGAPFASVPTLSVYPLPNQLTGTLVSNSAYATLLNYNDDFNDCPFNWTFRGCYAGAGANPGWVLKIDTMPMGNACSTLGVMSLELKDIRLYPNPAADVLHIESGNIESYEIYSMAGVLIRTGDSKLIDVSELDNGCYLIVVNSENGYVKKLFIKTN